MTNAAAPARVQADIVALTQRIPAGYMATLGDVARHLGVRRSLVAHLVSLLNEDERAKMPWWRIVADGGAIGRHKHRDAQVERLKEDGVPLSAAAVVQDLAARCIADLANPPEKPFTMAEPSNDRPPARSRGMKSH